MPFSSSAELGRLRCRHMAMQPITKKGKPPNMPTPAYSLGSSAPATKAITPTNTKLIHHGERNNTANKDFSDILNFTPTPEP